MKQAAPYGSRKGGGSLMEPCIEYTWMTGSTSQREAYHDPGRNTKKGGSLSGTVLPGRDLRHEHKSFEDDPDARIEMHDHMRFVSKEYRIEYVLDDEEYFTDKRIMTPAEILQKAGYHRSNTTLSSLSVTSKSPFKMNPTADHRCMNI